MESGNGSGDETMSSGGGDLHARLMHLVELLIRAEAAGEDVDIDVARSYGASAAELNQPVELALGNLIEVLNEAGVSVNGQIVGAVAEGYLAAVLEEQASTVSVAGGPTAAEGSWLAALHRINQAATASLELDAMLQTVVQVVRETMAGDSCSIFLYEPSSNSLVLRASVGLNPEATGRVTLQLGAGITGLAAQNRRIMAVADARNHPAYLDYPWVGDQSYTSHVSVPLALRSPDRLVGVLNILTLDRREFGNDELAFLQTAAGEMAIAIENAQLFHETDIQLRRRVIELSSLQTMSRTVASTLDLPVLLGVICEQAVVLTGALGAEIYRQGRDGSDEFELLLRYPEDEQPAFDTINAPVRDLVSEVFRSGSAIWRRFSDAEGDLYVHALPMMTGRRSVGALCIFQRSHPSSGSDAEALVHAFSDTAAIAIENAELYEEARRGYTRASTLLQEMHHRVRNNLQTVAALLSMQARHADNEDIQESLREAVGRIRSIAAVHDLLSGSNLQETTLDTVMRHVVEEARINILPSDSRISIIVEPSDVWVTSREATVFALLINEFIHNAVTHGFAGRNEGEIRIVSHTTSSGAVLDVIDDGRGFPPAFDIRSSAGLGFQIGRTLAQVDLRGSLDVLNRPEGGAVVRVTFIPARTTPEAAE